MMKYIVEKNELTGKMTNAWIAVARFDSRADAELYQHENRGVLRIELQQTLASSHAHSERASK